MRLNPLIQIQLKKEQTSSLSVSQTEKFHEWQQINNNMPHLGSKQYSVRDEGTHKYIV